MQFIELDVPAALQNSIRGFWYREMDFGTSPTIFEVLPDGHAEIVFHFGSGCSLKHKDKVESLPSPFIVGLLGQPIYFEAKGHLQIIGVKCLPWAMYNLLDLSSIKGGVSNLNHPIAALQPSLYKLLQAGCVNDALVLIRDWFIHKSELATPDSILKKAGQAMLKANGTLPVTSVAEAANSTVRTLERKFKSSSGHTMKNVSGLIRFEQARDRLWHQPDFPVVELAYELGYADQSHLNREFKRYSGITVGSFIKQTIKRKKELGGDFVAILLSS